MDKLVKFYQSKEWRTLRLKAIKRDHNECVVCRREGKYHVCQNVHHIHEVKERPDLALDLNNIECICIVHHNMIHERYQPKEFCKEKNKFNNFDSTEKW